jgi:uncharacterized protein
MLRLLQLAILLGIVWLIARTVRSMLAGNPRTVRRNGGGRPSATRGSAKTVVPCALCGLHVPESEALSAAGKYYCSAEHRDAAEH